MAHGEGEPFFEASLRGGEKIFDASLRGGEAIFDATLRGAKRFLAECHSHHGQMT